VPIAIASRFLVTQAIFWRDNLETAEDACHGGLIGRPDLVFEECQGLIFRRGFLTQDPRVNEPDD
jgi:hypothetical protein